MTRKDFESIATILRTWARPDMPPMHYEQLVLVMSAYLKDTNANFDLARFARACHVD